MQVLKFNIRNQRLSRYNSAIVASHSYNYLKTEFNFITDDWYNVDVKMANFYYRGVNYPVLLDENNQCYVPKEVIRLPSFSVSVFGGGITTNKLVIPVEDSGIFGEDTEISTKYYSEIINELTAKITTLNETKADNITFNEQNSTVQLTANDIPIGDPCEIPTHSCGIQSFIVNENDEIIVTLTNGTVINLGKIDGARGAVFIPHISDRKILSWTNNGGLPNPDPVDLNPFDDWDEDTSEYIWEEEV